MSDPLDDLSRRGVSVWLDDLSRQRLSTGSLSALISLISHYHVVSVTTNPTIFAKAIAGRRAIHGEREMSANSAYVIAGAGLAGAKAAETLRTEGFDGPVVLIGDEAEQPYERPPLSKDYLLGKAERETIYVHPRAVVRRQQRRACASACRSPASIQPSHEVWLADGSRIDYAKLLLATGSSPRRLPVPGAEADGVLYLRRVGDSDQLKAAFQAVSRIAVIGAGWIGLETAAAASLAGLETGNGVVVDARLRSSHPDIYAAGSTLPAHTTRCSAGTSGWSTGPTRCISRRRPPGRCSAKTSPMTGCRTSTPTSTT